MKMKATKQTTVGEGRAIVTVTADVEREDGMVWVDIQSVMFKGVDILDALTDYQRNDLEAEFSEDADIAEAA